MIYESSFQIGAITGVLIFAFYRILIKRFSNGQQAQGVT